MVHKLKKTTTKNNLAIEKHTSSKIDEWTLR